MFFQSSIYCETSNNVSFSWHDLISSPRLEKMSMRHALTERQLTRLQSQLDETREELEIASIQSDVWRSKFLASKYVTCLRNFIVLYFTFLRNFGILLRSYKRD